MATIAAAAGAVVLALNGAGVFSAAPAPATTMSTVSIDRPVTTVTVKPVRTHAIEDPRRIVIAVIGVDAEIIKVALKANGDMEVPPFGLAAWFELGPAPGEAGPAVIVAHVDSRRGRDVFYRLKDLRPGDQFSVHDGLGDSALFVVDYSEMVLKVDLPTEVIWESSREPLIRLITCGGDFDRKSGHYLSNIIVYGHLVR